MKALIYLLNIIIILCYPFLLPAQNYVNFRIENVYWVSESEWALDLYADLYIDGEPVENPSIYYYYWESNKNTVTHENMCNKGQFRE